MKSHRLARTFLFAGLGLALTGSAQAQIGSATEAQKISPFAGGFSGTLAQGDQFGDAVAGIGDIDLDGVPDAAVAAPFADDGGVNRGAVYILRLLPDGTVRDETRISATSGGFGGTLADQSQFGRRITNLGDLDGDGRNELGVLASRPERFYVLFLAADGSVSSETEVRYGDAVFQPPTNAMTFEQGGFAGIGDVDGDGIPDAAVGAPRDDDGFGSDSGALWIVHLLADGTPKSTQKISTLMGGMDGLLEQGENFGREVAHLGDLDGDGFTEISVRSDFGLESGIWTLFLDANSQAQNVLSQGTESTRLTIGPNTQALPHNLVAFPDLRGNALPEALVFGTNRFGVAELGSDGSLGKRLLNVRGQGGLAAVPSDEAFGADAAHLGDLDGDGDPEFIFGAPQINDGALFSGGVWIVSLSATAVRNGSGVNPLTLSSAQAPVLGTPWTSELDCSAHGSGLAVLLGWSAALDGVFLPQGELLIDPFGGAQLFMRVAAHTGGTSPFSIAVPPDPSWIDFVLHAQGLCTGTPGAQLSNGLAFVVGD